MRQQHSIIGRQPIVNVKENIIGYEFFFRNMTQAVQPFKEDMESCAQMLATTMDEMQDSWLLGQQLAFINVDHLMLNSAFLQLMPADKTVLELVKTLNVTAEVIARCQELKQARFKIALDNPHINTNLVPLLPLANYVKLDMREASNKDTQAWFKQYQQASTQIIAEKVETHAQYNDLKEAGYTHFQGYFFAQPQNVASKTINPSFDSVLNILNLVSQDADNKAIENGFKRDTTLSYKLLRYINSVGFGLSCEVQSLAHALTILGRNQLYRWLTLLMVTAGNNTCSPALLKTSIIRGRLTELLGETFFDKQERDSLFVVGVFSLLDVILKMPMTQVLEKLQLPEQIKQALTDRSGVFGPILKLTEACENENQDILNLAEMLHIEADKVNQCHIEALRWTESLGV